MFSLLDSIIDAQESGASIVSENHDLDSITPAAPDFDPSEFAPTKEAAMRRASLDTSTGRVALMSARRRFEYVLTGTADEMKQAAFVLASKT